MGRWYRFGYACVNFGRPLSMRDYYRQRRIDLRTVADDDRRRHVAGIAGELMQHIGDVTPVLPVSLVATVLLTSGETALSALEIKSAVFALMSSLEKSGAHVYIPRSDQDYAVSVGLRMLILRRMVDERDGLFSARVEEFPVLRYYANSIAHLVAVTAQISSGG